ncbi:MAG TPA: hypothetical protein VKV24_04455 [Casimicrobiaceae bacterium]|nr:hypothetical protein [Casimicrobiaceae bacterium]
MIGSAVAALNDPDTKLEMGIPAEFTAVAPIIVGAPEGKVAAKTRHEPIVLAWR